MNKRIKGLMVGCSLGIVTMLAAPAWAAAAAEQESPAPPAADMAFMTLEQLDEVVLEGKRLEQRVAESEARFYKRYSQLNSRDDFDVSCTFEWDDGTMSPSARKRSCVPAFYLKAVGMEASLMSPAPSFCGNGFQPMVAGTAVVSGYNYFDGVGGSSTMQPWHADSGRTDCSATSPVRRISNRPNLVYLDKRAEFLANLLRVVNSDQQLRTMAGELDALAEEGKEGKRRATEAARLRRAEQKCARPVSPRAVTVCNSKGRA